jgi:hypothetical protein
MFATVGILTKRMKFVTQLFEIYHVFYHIEEIKSQMM